MFGLVCLVCLVCLVVLVVFIWGVRARTGGRLSLSFSPKRARENRRRRRRTATNDEEQNKTHLGLVVDGQHDLGHARGLERLLLLLVVIRGGGRARVREKGSAKKRGK
jgi:hypothetical protein